MISKTSGRRRSGSYMFISLTPSYLIHVTLLVPLGSAGRGNFSLSQKKY